MKSKTFLALPLLLLLASPAHAYEEGDRTANRDVGGHIIYPDKYFGQQPFAEFKSGVSNHDAQNQHPQQWDGQDWDPSAWNQKQWTPEIVVKNLYQNRTFNKQYVRGGKIPVLEVGPTFYKLSGLDQRRSVKLIADYEGVFENGFSMIELRDWRSRDVVGSYTKQGLVLN